MWVHYRAMNNNLLSYLHEGFRSHHRNHTYIEEASQFSLHFLQPNQCREGREKRPARDAAAARQFWPVLAWHTCIQTEITRQFYKGKLLGPPVAILTSLHVLYTYIFLWSSLLLYFKVPSADSPS